MKNLILLIVFIGFLSCANEAEEVNPIQENQDIALYRYKTFLIQVNYADPMIETTFTLLEKPNGGHFTDDRIGYKPNLYFKAPSIPDWAVFTIRGIYSRYDTITYQDLSWGTRYLIRVKK